VTYFISTGPEAVARWLRTSDAYDVLDDAVMGCLETSVVLEICEDFVVTPAQFRAALDKALREGC
jgi:hypothetical protein